MENIEKQLIHKIKTIQRRFNYILIINNILLSVITTSLVAGGVIAISRFVPVYNVLLKALALMMLGVLGGVVWAFIKPVDLKTTAQRIDRFGLKERIITSLELIGDNSAFALLQKEDALFKLNSLDVKSKIPIKPNKNYIISCTLLILLVPSLTYIPNSMNEKAKEIHVVNELKKAEIKKVEKIKDKVMENTKLSEWDKMDIENHLYKLKQEIKKADNKKDIDKILQKTEKKLEFVKKEYINNDIKNIADSLSKFKETKELAKVLKNLDKDAIKKQMKQLNNAIKNMSAKDRKELAKNMKALAESMKNNQELRGAMQKFSKALANNELGDISQELKDLDKSIADAMENDEELKNALAEMQKDLNKMQQNPQSHNDGCDGKDTGGT